jgi:hypothetical protein
MTVIRAFYHWEFTEPTGKYYCKVRPMNWNRWQIRAFNSPRWKFALWVSVAAGALLALPLALLQWLIDALQAL